MDCRSLADPGEHGTPTACRRMFNEAVSLTTVVAEAHRSILGPRNLSIAIIRRHLLATTRWDCDCWMINRRTLWGPGGTYRVSSSANWASDKPGTASLERRAAACGLPHPPSFVLPSGRTLQGIRR